MTGISEYLKNIEKALKRGDSTEHTHRPALKELIESLGKGVVATNEPKRVACGAPDFIVTKKDIPIGYIEAKDVGISLDDVQKTDQLKRYLESLNSLLLTDYIEFRWYVNSELRFTAQLATAGKDGGLKHNKDGVSKLEELLNDFVQQHIPIITGPRELARRMAGIARLMREIIANVLKEDKDDSGSLQLQMKGFRDVLLRDLTKEQFADMYAQTICYGLFAARCSPNATLPFARKTAWSDLPRTNPFLRKMFAHIAGAELDDRVAWVVDDLAELLNRADIGSILEDFGRRTKREDPVVHFYETFLAAYDPAMRESRGVYYTPEPVVSYIVRSVDHILKNDFGLKDGLTDTSRISYSRTIEDPNTKKQREINEECHKVLILDPAVGTGTFLHGVIDHIHEFLIEQGQGGTWSSYVSQHLLPRIFGFELLMAPYTVAHMKLGIQLAELGYDFKSNERLGIYLTNTLQEAHEVIGGPMFATWLTEEANAAVKVKLDLPILVVMGNPPYSGHSANKGKWIEQLLKGKDISTGQTTDSYFEVDGKPLKEKNPKYLHDDYVKFIRFAQWRISRTGFGILAFISNHGYIDNPTFRGMRQSLIEMFDDIYILNLHGNVKKKEKTPEGLKDDNVFDIQQGVAIGIFVKYRTAKKKRFNVRYADLWGQRKDKYSFLLLNNVSSVEWKFTKPASPFYLFEPLHYKLANEYEGLWKINDIFTTNSTGVKTHRDHFAMDFDFAGLKNRIKDFRNPRYTDAEIAEKYDLSDTRDWKLDIERRALVKQPEWEKYFIQYLYRPFDFRYLYYNEHVLELPRERVMGHMLVEDNLALVTVRQVAEGIFNHVFISRYIGDGRITLSNKGMAFVFPLYLYPDPDINGELFPNGALRHVNMNEKFISEMSGKLGLRFLYDRQGDLKKSFGPEDIFNYIYAILHSPTYRSRYAEFLKMDFPRIPLISSKPLFRELCGLGGELVSLHLMEESGPMITRYPVSGDDTVENVRYTEPGQGADDGRVWINKKQYFEGVTPDIWEFHIGGYQVCRKWLKDRKGRKLNFDDINHYQKVVSAVSDTMRIMNEIDAAIDEHGGWPIQ